MGERTVAATAIRRRAGGQPSRSRTSQAPAAIASSITPANSG